MASIVICQQKEEMGVGEWAIISMHYIMIFVCVKDVLNNTSTDKKYTLTNRHRSLFLS